MAMHAGMLIPRRGELIQSGPRGLAGLRAREILVTVKEDRMDTNTNDSRLRTWRKQRGWNIGEMADWAWRSPLSRISNAESAS